MSSSETGFNQALADDAVDLLISGGADVRLMTQALDYDDLAADLDTKEVSGASYAAQTVAEADWSVTYDQTTNELTLENGVAVDFGKAGEDWGVVEDVAIHNAGTSQFIIADEPNNPNITEGEAISFPIGEITYTLGP